CTCKSVTVVIDVETRRLGSIRKSPITVVMQKEVGRAVAGVEIRGRIAILIKASVVVVEAKINVEAAVVVIVGQRGMGKSALRRASESNRITLQRKLALTAVHEQQRSAASNDEQVLMTAVLELREQCAGGGVKNIEPSGGCDVLKCPIPA